MTPFASCGFSFDVMSLSLPDQLRATVRFLRRGRGGDARPDTLAGAIRALKAEGVGLDEVVELLRGALVAPVITAHPSEVRRKSVLDRVSAIADDLDAHDRAHGEVERAALERDLMRQV